MKNWFPKLAFKFNSYRYTGGDGGSREMKLAYHRCIRRWHPDKFAARFKQRLEGGGESERVMERVNAVARALTTEFAKHS